MSILNGLCACDSCGVELQKGRGALNIRKNRLYCLSCWEKMKSYDPQGEELPLSESWQDAVNRTNFEWN
ncbi:MAG: hypothetical protein ABIG64_04525 [Candidatus Omnitrophota bacterium]